MAFVKGDPRINRTGRPVGAVDKRWATLQYWFERLQTTLDDPLLSIDVRANIELQMAKLLLERKKLPPEDPEDSVKNALEIQEGLKKLEEDARRGAKSVSH